VGEESRTGRRRRRSLIEAALALMALAVLLGLSLRALVPFLGAFLWAAVLSVFGWPLVGRLRRATGLGLTPAAALVSLGYTLLLALPLLTLSLTVAEAVEDAAALVEELAAGGLPPPPPFLERVPVVGPRLAALWREDAADLPGLLARSEGDILLFGQFVMRELTDLVTALGELGFGILLAFQLLAAGPAVTTTLRRLAVALGGPAGEEALRVTTRAVSVVATGIIGGAVVEALLSALGYWLAGLPLAPLLALGGFVLRLLQVGPWPVWALAVLWLWLGQDAPGAALGLAAWFAAVAWVGARLGRRLVGARTLVPRPVLFLAVLGGLAAWGFTGMFLGAAAVTVGWTLTQRWLDQRVGEEGPPPD
jgi:predicted PurR-regulated permease PerM